MFKDGEKVTLLHLAASCNLENIVNALIEKGANVNEKGAGGETPLHETTHLKSINIANVLIKKGADVNSVDMLGNTPLHYLNRSAIKKGQIDGGAATLLGIALLIIVRTEVKTSL
ncbi:ankyrin repeat domain-containing protein [Wolbachia endosymbiont of Leptopilina clavipes]|uniref:ankyrin repeat domain-containing protein n=1 Tax=Wolbachia endosymbiont of Leptopilina clavipes TaxID=260213 RepID=UPI001FE7FB60